MIFWPYSMNNYDPGKTCQGGVPLSGARAEPGALKHCNSSGDCRQALISKYSFTYPKLYTGLNLLCAL